MKRSVTGATLILMITHASEWVYYRQTNRKIPNNAGTQSALCGMNVKEEQQCQKRHILFPAIVPDQFIQGSPEYIPLYHDGILMNEREEFERLLEGPKS